MKRFVILLILISSLVSCSKPTPEQTVETVIRETFSANFEETFNYYDPGFGSQQQIADYRGFVNDVVAWEKNIKKTKKEVLSAIQGLLSFKVVDVKVEGNRATVRTVIIVPEFDNKFDMQIALLKLTRPPLVSNRAETNAIILKNINEGQYELKPVEVIFSLMKKDKWRVNGVTNVRGLWRFEN
ncbi:hypothetical protein ABMA70_14275 [Halobacteriovorax sp. XZX-3]|uniref:hypothetical protein n=1 Tax=unclassified Halobacteriovorax TaxID=2639665 RepID=UPI003714300A